MKIILFRIITSMRASVGKMKKMTKKTTMVLLVFLLITVVAETTYIVVKLQGSSIDNDARKLILESTSPGSGLEIYDNLRLIDCTIHPMEVYPDHYDIELTDYSAFLIMAKGSTVEMGQEFSFELNPSFLTWEERDWLSTKTPYGLVVWRTTFTSNEFVTGLTQKESYRNMIGRKLEILDERLLFDVIDSMLNRQEAVTLGVYFLNDVGYATGKLVSAELVSKEPNYFWHELAELEKPNIQEERTCWVVKLTRADFYPTQVLEVWVDDYTGKIMGGHAS
jgi:hypothetical protein